MEESLKNMVEALIKKAEKEGKKIKLKPTRRSSLHQIIKTPEQAKRFMRLLEAAQRQ